MTAKQENVETKALRLLAERRTHRSIKSHVFMVEGDTGVYITTVVCIADSGNPYTGACTCKYGREQENAVNLDNACSHLRAAVIEVERSFT